MKEITKELKQKMQNFDESHQRLEILKDKYEGETAYIVTGGPSLNNHNVDELKSFLSDKLVIGIKQTYDLFYEEMDYQLLNAVNIKTYDYKTDDTIVAWTVYQQDQPYYIIENDVPCDFMTPIYRNHGSIHNTIAATGDWSEIGFDVSFERPWGPGLMYELAIPLSMYLGCKKIVTIGWDIGVLREHEKGQQYINYDHFYQKGRDKHKVEYDGVNVERLPIGGSGGITYDEVKMNIEGALGLYEYLKGRGIDFSIVSDRNPASELIPRKTMKEIYDADTK